MHVDVVSLFPEFVQAVTACGVTGRAVKRGVLTLECWNPRHYTHDTHRTVDDRPYGGGPGMVMKADVLHETLQAVQKAKPEPQAKVIYLSPQGQRLDQQHVQQLTQEPALILLAGRYEGVDERFIAQSVDLEYSIGDYVLSGGELAAMVLIDAMTRLLPGVLGHDESAQQDSFMAGLLDHPHYTRPEYLADGQGIPSVLKSGNHAAIARWRQQQALGRTWQRRPDLLAQRPLSDDEQQLLDAYRQEHEQT